MEISDCEKTIEILKEKLQKLELKLATAQSDLEKLTALSNAQEATIAQANADMYQLEKEYTKLRATLFDYFFEKGLILFDT